ncbi:MAG: MBL fold metallo-hydrolase [Deltaproteobacteria bacterium]|nr:MBL fold metallo-hydrolase [Deltaproteobacteria bacterium]
MKKEYKLSREILPDVFSITLPLPGKRPGPVNVYLFKGREVTLIDTGTAQTAGFLQKALGEHGLRFADIDRIIVTHGHPDHYGAAKKIVTAGRAKVAAHAEDIVSIENGMEVSANRYRNFLQLMGVPISIGILLGLLFVVFKHMADNCVVDIVMHGGEEIEIGRYRAKIIDTPGHSKGSVCVFLDKEKILFCGDTIIEHITPNAFIMLDEKEVLPVRLSQDEFYKSLDKIKGLSPSMIYSAHGKKIPDIEQIIDGYKKSFAERQAKVLSIVNSGEKNVYRIARLLFPEIGGVRLPLEIFLSISEVYTNIQVLQRDGKISLNIRNGLLEVT